MRMIAQQVVEEQRQVCAAVSGADLQRWAQLEKSVKAFIEDERERFEKRGEKLDALVLDVTRIDNRWKNLPAIVTVTAVMSTIALVISVAALVVAILSG